jgi:hypothetical protein
MPGLFARNEKTVSAPDNARTPKLIAKNAPHIPRTTEKEDAGRTTERANLLPERSCAKKPAAAHKIEIARKT